jgi:hypothetical protein
MQDLKGPSTSFTNASHLNHLIHWSGTTSAAIEITRHFIVEILSDSSLLRGRRVITAIRLDELDQLVLKDRIEDKDYSYTIIL